MGRELVGGGVQFGLLSLLTGPERVFSQFQILNKTAS